MPAHSIQPPVAIPATSEAPSPAASRAASRAASLALAGTWRAISLSLLLAASIGWSQLQADNHVLPAKINPVKMSKEQIAGKIFEDYKPIVAEHNGNTTHDVEAFLSSDKQFDAGMYRSGKVKAEITKPYGVNEYMHFLEGGVTLTSSDGTVTEISAGDSVVIPAEWTGTWDTEGYTKIYVIYSPGKPITP